MKRIIFIVSAVVFMVSVPVLFAQVPSEKGMDKMQRKTFTPEEIAKMDEERIDQRVAIMTTDLNLSADQQKQVKAILVKTNATIRKMMEEIRTNVETLIKGDQEKIKALLTPVQKTKLDQLIAEATMGQQMQPPPPAPKLEKKK